MLRFLYFVIVYYLFNINIIAEYQPKPNNETLDKIKLNTGYIVQSDSSILNQNKISYKYLFSYKAENWFYIFPPGGVHDGAQKNALFNSGVNEVYADEVIWAQAVPDDPMFGLQWGMSLVELDKTNPEIQQSWNKKAKMYICDSGPPADVNGKITHEDLINPPNNRYIVGNNYALVYSITENNDTVYVPSINRNWDDIGHSTHVAGVAGAMSNNGLGVAGVDWVSEMTFEKVLRDGAGWGFVSWLMFSIIDADIESRERQMDIIVNISAGGIVPYRPLEKLIAYLDESRNKLGYGVILVCAAGNHASESLLFPAAYSHWGVINSNGYDNVISVGSVTLDSTDHIHKASYSAYGDFVDIWAPGGSSSDVRYIDQTYRVQWDAHSVWSLAPDSVAERPFYPHWYNADDYPYNYFRQAGTSMAAPYVTGAVCRLLDYLGGTDYFHSAKEIKEALRNSGTMFAYRGYIEDKYGKKYESGDQFQGYVLNLRRFWEENHILSSVQDADLQVPSFQVKQNYPNPFNSGTKIEYYIPNESAVELSIYDILGEVVAKYNYSLQESGSHYIDFDASELTSGVYIYSITAGNINIVKKMQLLK